MILTAKLIGFLIFAMGVAITAYPPFTQKLFAFFKSGQNIYLAGVIRIVTGVILLVAMSGSTVPIAAASLGILFLASGIVIFAAGPEKTQAFLTFYSEMPGPVLRLLGLVAASFGILIFSIF